MRIAFFVGSRSDTNLQFPLVQEAENRGHVATTIDTTEITLRESFVPRAAPAVAARLAAWLERLDMLAPDCLVVVGDRWEALLAAETAKKGGIPVVHVCAGDETLGSRDEVFRWEISKTAALWCCSTETARQEMVRRGWPPEAVHTTGSPGLDAVATFAGKPTGEMPPGDFVLCGVYPETAEEDPLAVVRICAAAVRLFLADGRAGWSAVFLAPLCDDKAGEARTILSQTRDWGGRMANFPGPAFHEAMRRCRVFVGNSSAILYEAPFLRVPSVLVGSRQQGRQIPIGVRRSAVEEGAIQEAMAMATVAPRPRRNLTYGDGHAAPRILAAIEAALRDGSAS